MSRGTVGRRGVLSGGLAVILAAAPGVCSGEGVDHAILAGQDQDLGEDEDLQEEDDCRLPIRVAFLEWLRTESGRFTLPVSVDTTVSSRGKLRIAGVHPAIQVSLPSYSSITVSVVWEDVGWDSLLWLDAYEEPGPDGVGWIDKTLYPEFQIVHPTREALWRADVFEPLLTWVNEDLAYATHLAMWGMDDGATWARLVRDGRVLRRGLDLGGEWRNARAPGAGSRPSGVTVAPGPNAQGGRLLHGSRLPRR